MYYVTTQNGACISKLCVDSIKQEIISMMIMVCIPWDAEEQGGRVKGMDATLTSVFSGVPLVMRVYLLSVMFGCHAPEVQFWI